MARVTVEDCLAQVGNRFALVLLASRRAQQLLKGAPPLVRCTNKAPVTSLREIAEGKVRFEGDLKAAIESHLKYAKELGQWQAAQGPRRRMIEAALGEDE